MFDGLLQFGRHQPVVAPGVATHTYPVRQVDWPAPGAAHVERQVLPLKPKTASVMHTPELHGCVALHCAVQKPPVKPVALPKTDSWMQMAPPGGWHCMPEVHGEPTGTGTTAPPSGCTHWPAVHALPKPQGWHCAPPVPHERPVLPAWHWPFWQQPVAQVVASHGGGTAHAPLTHDWPMGHCMHALPPAPHAKRFC